MTSQTITRASRRGLLLSAAFALAFGFAVVPQSAFAATATMTIWPGTWTNQANTQVVSDNGTNVLKLGPAPESVADTDSAAGFISSHADWDFEICTKYRGVLNQEYAWLQLNTPSLYDYSGSGSILLPNSMYFQDNQYRVACKSGLERFGNYDTVEVSGNSGGTLNATFFVRSVTLTATSPLPPR